MEHAKASCQEKATLACHFSSLMLFSLALVGYALSYLTLPSSPYSPANALQDERLFFMATAVFAAFALIFNGWRAARRGRQRGDSWR